MSLSNHWWSSLPRYRGFFIRNVKMPLQILEEKEGGKGLQHLPQSNSSAARHCKRGCLLCSRPTSSQIPSLETVLMAPGMAFHPVTSRPGSRSQGLPALGKSQVLPFHFLTVHFFCRPLCLKSLSAAINLPRENTEAQISCIEVVKGLGFLTLRNGSRGVEQIQRWVSLERLKIQLR